MNIILPFDSFPVLYESRTRTLENGQKYRIMAYKNKKKIVIGFEAPIHGSWQVSHSIGVTKNDLN